MVNINRFIPSVNYHLWEACNMKCKFCFATFQDVKQSVLPKGHLSKEKSIDLIIKLAKSGFEKITFAGGEPTLCKWLPELISTAKKAGLTTMLVTNGSMLNDSFLQKNDDHLDWIALSIDSLNPDTNRRIGRISNNVKSDNEYYLKLINRVKSFGYGLKINTVVNTQNYKENMNDFILAANPKRWKILQVLPIVGQNDLFIKDLTITEAEFQIFLETHSELTKIIIPENNNQVLGSYAMIDPAGRFFDNALGTHRYSNPILDVGVLNALMDVAYDYSKFISRGGKYNWEI